VYAPISLLSFLILLPLAPFVHKVHRLLTIVTLVIFIASTTYVWLTHPFSPDARLRVAFEQHVELTDLSRTTSRPQLTRAVTQLSALEDYGPRLVGTLPSSWNSSSSYDCWGHEWLTGLTTCAWAVPAGLQPSIPSSRDNEKGSWFVANVTRLGPVSLRAEIEGFHTRACRIYLDSHRIRRYRVRTHQKGGATAWTNYEMPQWRGTHFLALWGRAFGSRFEVELGVDGDGQVAGRVSCLWNDGPGGARIPALEEARAFLPEWVAITSITNGLVEASSGFVLREE